MEILNTKYYSTDEVAGMLQITRRTMLNYISAGKIAGKKLGRSWFFTEEDIKAFLDSKGTAGRPKQK